MYIVIQGKNTYIWKYHFVGIVKESVLELNSTLRCDILKRSFFQL